MTCGTRQTTGGTGDTRRARGGRILLLVAMALFVATDSFGVMATVASKADFLAAVVKASDGNGRLQQDLDVVFTARCAPMVIGEGDLWNESTQCILDCDGHRISLDARRCPSGTVIIGKKPDDVPTHERTVAIKGCGKGSLFRNLTVANHGRIDFTSSEGTLVKDCDFINCGSSAPGAGSGGAIKGCDIVEGCGFERCGARFGGAVSDCGYVKECLFLGCRAYEAGGAIFGDADVFRCEFNACGCGSSSESGGLGGAIYGGRDIVSCLFVDCSARKGGAIMSDGGRDGFHVKVVHSTFVRFGGETNDEAVFENPEGLPIWMLNCLCHGCGLWQNGADEDDKFGCYRLKEVWFFRDYDNGDFHPNPVLSEEWTDPGGLRFGESGAAMFVCRDLDGYGYQLDSPWPACPGCYRFRRDVEREGFVPDESARNSRHAVVKPRKSAKPGHWRIPLKMDHEQIPGFGHSVQNRPFRAIAWYERKHDPFRFFELRESVHADNKVVSRPGPGAELLVAKTGPDEAIYYGTAGGRPEGLPEDMRGKRITDLEGIRYLYVDGKAGEIPPEAFMRSTDLETVHFKCYHATNAESKVVIKCDVTNVAERAFAESPKLKLVVFEEDHSIRIANNAFDGCAPSMCGATVGIPVSITYRVSRGTNLITRTTENVTLKTRVLPVDGLFSTHIFLCDDQLNRRLHVDGDFLWSEEEEGANALMCIGEGRDVFVPERLGGRPVVALGRNLLHRRWGGFEYGILAIPSTIRSMPIFPGPHKVRKVFAACELGDGIRHVLSPETVVYGTTPNRHTGALVPLRFGWRGKEVLVPRGTNPHDYFASHN